MEHHPLRCAKPGHEISMGGNPRPDAERIAKSVDLIDNPCQLRSA
jgi:hypothetical protein